MVPNETGVKLFDLIIEMKATQNSSHSVNLTELFCVIADLKLLLLYSDLRLLSSDKT